MARRAAAAKAKTTTKPRKATPRRAKAAAARPKSAAKTSQRTSAKPKRGPAKPPRSRPVTLLVGTAKGAFVLRSDGARAKWKLEGPLLFGHVVNHVVSDPREPRTWLMATKTGHLGPTIMRSSDGGRSWVEAKDPPRFPKSPDGTEGRAVDSTFWLTPGHPSQPGTWFCGTIPLGLFRSDDGGDTWQGVAGLNEHPDIDKWCPMAPPGGPYTHSILVDPRDARHMYVGLSAGGVVESTDGGATWRMINKGCTVDFLPNKEPEYGQDPHCVVASPSDPDRLWQQNHCGIFLMDRAEGRWRRVGLAMPKDTGDIGFPIIAHPRDRDRAFVFPMDGTDVWPRTSPGHRPAVYATRDGGGTWRRMDQGFPKAHGYFTVYRQGMADDGRDPLGLYIGTTQGEVWASADEGASWACVARWLPKVLSVEVMP